MPLKEGRNVTAEVWQWKKRPQSKSLSSHEETIIPEQDCQIPFVSLYPCGRPRRETAVLLCNWGLSITGFMHDFSGLRTVSSTCPAVLRPCFCRMHLLWSVYCFFTERLVLIWQECSVWDALWFLTCLVFSVLRRSRAGNLHAALTIEGIWYWLRSVWDFDKCESGNGWETLGASREAVVLTDLITQKAVGSVPRGEREGLWDPVKIYAAYNHLTQPWF